MAENDQAYANMDFIPDGASYPAKWAAAAAAFRAAHGDELDLPYGDGPRERFDLFRPKGLVKGVVIFVHGGYWLRFDKSYWSHLAAGPMAHGWAVAMPSYDLCPDVTIPQITAQVATACAAIRRQVIGPVRLVGHSAGGHLVARMGAVAPDWVERIMPVSPVSNLAPLMLTSMNADLRIDDDVVQAESPVHQDAPAADVIVWVGGSERPAFIDQARWLAHAWSCAIEVEPVRHHFDVIEALADPDSAMVQALLS